MESCMPRRWPSSRIRTRCSRWTRRLAEFCGNSAPGARSTPGLPWWTALCTGALVTPGPVWKAAGTTGSTPSASAGGKTSVKEQSVSFDGYRFDADAGRLWSGTREIHLTPKASAVLTQLVAHAGEPVSKEDLFATV